MTDRPHILWQLSGFADVIRCEMFVDPRGCALGLRMGEELIQTELLPDETAARARANALRDRLLQRGWIPRN